MMRFPAIMGVLNVTPDSFSDGGQYVDLARAVSRGMELIGQGADIIDVGGESSRPGAQPVALEEELRRTVGVVEALSPHVTVSIDTTKFEVARAAVDAGATIINDISGGADIRLAELLMRSQATLVLMHMQGTPQTMQQNPHYASGVVPEVISFFKQRCQQFEEAGVNSKQLWIDPGIGFGKSLEDNILLLRHLSEFKQLGKSILIGTSRKSFLSKMEGVLEVSERLPGTLSSNLFALKQGAHVFRVHDVLEMKRAMHCWQLLEGEQP